MVDKDGLAYRWVPWLFAFLTLATTPLISGDTVAGTSSGA